MSEDGLSWLLVATKPRSEFVARQHLESQGFRVCMPLAAFRKRKQGKWRQVTEPMFPGYVFVGVTLGEHDIAPIRSTRGCRELVRFGGQLVPLPESVMQSFASHDQAPKVVNPVLEKGQKVRIERGVFAGLEAVFERPRGEARVQLLLTVLGHLRSVLVPAGSIGAYWH